MLEEAFAEWLWVGLAWSSAAGRTAKTGTKAAGQRYAQPVTRGGEALSPGLAARRGRRVCSSKGGQLVVCKFGFRHFFCLLSIQMKAIAF